jgi:hypothetical protein
MFQLGFKVHPADARNGDYRWLTVQHPDQPSLQLGLFSRSRRRRRSDRADLESMSPGAMPPSSWSSTIT